MNQITKYEVRNTKDQKVCPHYGLCGGCSRQDVPYADQLVAKEKIVRGCLDDLSVKTWHPILPSPEIHFYRNKMEFSFGDQRDLEILKRPRKPLPTLPTVKRGEEFLPMSHNGEGREGGAVHVGLHPKGRFALVTPTPECQLLSEESRTVCQVVADWANAHGVSVYVRKSGEGDLRHLVIREGKNTNERLVNLVSKSTTPHVEELANRLKDSGAPITTFIWTGYDGLSDVAKGDNQTVFWGEGTITEKTSGVTLRVNSDSFMQTNTHAAEMMIGVLKKFLPMSHNGEGREGSSLIDLYCGSGIIGLCLANEFEEVIGIELNKNAIIDARRNAEMNGISNIRFLEGKAEDLAPTLPLKNTSETSVVVDPPRAGLHPTMLKTLLEWSVPSLFYVSCNPETLARDLKALAERYDILDVQPMDFFPHTDHIETAVQLCKKS